MIVIGGKSLIISNLVVDFFRINGILVRYGDLRDFLGEGWGLLGNRTLRLIVVYFYGIWGV